MPGVLVLEALAQTGAIALLSEPENAGQIVYFGGVKNARFRHPVRPGDILLLECNLTKRRGAVGFGQGIAMVNDKIACSAEISFIISQQQNEQIA
jgi:3-hydroxyacyl-[acyl-carrier-protein] dehydratase